MHGNGDIPLFILCNHLGVIQLKQQKNMVKIGVSDSCGVFAATGQ